MLCGYYISRSCALHVALDNKATRQQGRSMSNCSHRYWADRRCLKPSGVLCVWKTALAASWSHEEVTVRLWAGLQRSNWSIAGSCSAAMVKAWSQLCVRFEQLDSRNLLVRWPPTEVRRAIIFTLYAEHRFTCRSHTRALCILKHLQDRFFSLLPFIHHHLFLFCLCIKINIVAFSIK